MINISQKTIGKRQHGVHFLVPHVRVNSVDRYLPTNWWVPL